MSQDSPTLIPVPFHGDTITAVETPEGVMVAISPICERLGIASNKQIARLKAEKSRWRGDLMVAPSAGGAQETYCIPLTKLSGWLASIGLNRVKPEVRERLALYQDEADAVLDRHFRQRAEERGEEIRQLRGQLDHSHSHLRAALPKWGQILAMVETGTFGLDVIAARVAMTQDRLWAETEAIRRCGLMLPEGVADNSAPAWLARIDALERQLRREREARHAAQADAVQPSLFAEG